MNGTREEAHPQGLPLFLFVNNQLFYLGSPYDKESLLFIPRIYLKM